jgi:hypothetical protein
LLIKKGGGKLTNIPNLNDKSIFEKIDLFIAIMQKKCPIYKKDELKQYLGELISLKYTLREIKDKLKEIKLFGVEGPASIIERAEKIQEYTKYHAQTAQEIQTLIKEINEYVNS